MNNKTIKLAEDTIELDEINNLCEWLKLNKQLTKGPLTIEFEKIFSEYIGCKYSVFVNSGSSANLLMYYALLQTNKLKNKKVVVPAVSWVTTLSPAMQLGFEPILCDSDSSNLGVDINHLEKIFIEHNPSVLILVHVLGHINKMQEINILCKKYNVIILEDACEALGTKSIDNKMIGNIGFAGSFSFYYGHHISTIEGGMITTNDKEMYNILLSIRSHGWLRDLEKDFANELKKDFVTDDFRELYTFYYPGFNVRSTDLNAFLGISQIKKMPNIAKVREENFLLYKKYINRNFWFQQSEYSVLSSFAFGTFVENRIEVYKELKQNNIECRPLICGSMGRQPFWIKQYGEIFLPVADKVHDYGIYLPNHANINEEQIIYIASVFNKIAKPI